MYTIWLLARVAVSSSSTACVAYAPRNTRMLYDKAADKQPYDMVQVLSLGSPFLYNIPSFDLLSVEMRQVRINGYTAEDKQVQYDIFVCNHSASDLDRVYPWWMTIKDATIIEVKHAFVLHEIVLLHHGTVT